MAEITGQNFNINQSPTTPSSISVDSTTAVTLIPAPPSFNNPWRWMSFYNDGNQPLWLRFYTAATDNTKRGTLLAPGESLVFQLPNMPSTEISGIMNSGGARNVYVQYF
jgi:hypothetical protein